MARFLLTSDWHCHDYPGSENLADGTNARLAEILDAVRWMVGVAAERGCTAMIHAGDLFHTRKQVPTSCLALTSEALQAAGEHFADGIYVLDGNHDMTPTGDGRSSVQAMRGLVRPVTWNEVLIISGVKVGFLPYSDDPEVVRKASAAHAKAGCRLLVGHLGIGDGRFADAVPVDYEIPGHISVDDLSPRRFEQVLLGHYHNPQSVIPNVHYIGAPLQLSFKEAGQSRGFRIWDDATGLEWHENTVSPRYHVVQGDHLVDVEAAAAFMAGVSASRNDRVWAKTASKGEQDAARAVLGDQARVDLSALPATVRARIADVSGPDLLLAYVATTRPDLASDLAEQQAIAKAGQEILDAAH